MALASILFTELRKDGFKIEAVAQELFLDVTISEQPTFNNRVTTNPIEDGSFINDHVIEDPDTVTIEGIISDSPVRVLSGVRDIVEKGFGSTDRSKNAFDLLLDLKRNKTIVSLHNGLTIYANMIITQFTPRRNRTTGRALRFNLTLQRVKTVTSKVIDLPAVNILDVHANTTDQIQSTADAGKQSTKTPGAQVQTKMSLLYKGAQLSGLVP